MGAGITSGGCCNCGGSGGGGISIPNCYCSSFPMNLTMTSCSTTCNFAMFQPCTIVYGPPPPSIVSAGTGNGYFSTAEFYDSPSGSYFYYYLTCQSGSWYLTRIFPTSPYGSPYRDTTLYQWLTSTSGSNGNYCLPGPATPGATGLLLSNGAPYSGSDANCCVTIYGGSLGPAPNCRVSGGVKC